MKLKHLALAGLVLGVAVAVFCLLADRGGSSRGKDRANGRSAGKGQVSAKTRGVPGKTAEKARKAVRGEVDDDNPWGASGAHEQWFEKLPAADRKLAEDVQAASDGENWAKMSKAAAKALKSQNPEVRKHALEGLASFGEKALPDLTPSIGDPDEEVAEEAINQVEHVIMGMDDEDSKFMVAASYLNTFTANDNAIRMFSGIMQSAMPDVSGNTEGAVRNREGVVDVLAQLVEKGGKVAEAAKEAYESLTSHGWISVDEARFWAQDPENYEEPE